MQRGIKLFKKLEEGKKPSRRKAVRRKDFTRTGRTRTGLLPSYQERKETLLPAELSAFKNPHQYPEFNFLIVLRFSIIHGQNVCYSFILSHFEFWNFPHTPF